MQSKTCKWFGIFAIIISVIIAISGFVIGNHLGKTYPTAKENSFSSYLVSDDLKYSYEFNQPLFIGCGVSGVILGLLFFFNGITMIAVSETISTQGYILNKQVDLQQQCQDMSKSTSKQSVTKTSLHYDDDNDSSVLERFINSPKQSNEPTKSTSTYDSNKLFF